MEFGVEGLVDAALLGRLSVSREEMLKSIPRYNDENHLTKVNECGFVGFSLFGGGDLRRGRQ